METVIAIGVLAVLLTAFMAVFGPATKGIRRAINVQEADRLVATLEKEASILRPSQAAGPGGADAPNEGRYLTAFNKAFYWLRDSSANKTNPPADPGKLIMLYQYRGDPGSANSRADGTMTPFTGSGLPGQDYVVQSMARLRDDPLFLEDIKAVEGRVFAVETTQLYLSGGQLVPAPETGKMYDTAGKSWTTPDQYPEAVIAFTAAFYDLPSTAAAYLGPNGKLDWNKYRQSRKPVFTRNLGVRR